MGALITGVNVEDVFGNAVSTFWVEILAKIQEKPTPNLKFELRAYTSEANRDSNRVPIRFIDTQSGDATTIPEGMFNREMNYPLTAGQYASVPMTTITNQVVDMLANGETDAQFQTLFPTVLTSNGGPGWPGLGVANVAADMPV